MTCDAEYSFMFMTPPSRPLPSPLPVWLSSISRSSLPPSPPLYHFYRNQLPNNKLRRNFAKESLKFSSLTWKEKEGDYTTTCQRAQTRGNTGENIFQLLGISYHLLKIGINILRAIDLSLLLNFHAQVIH